MKTTVKIKLQVEGQHCWPEAAKIAPEVAFLSHPHRHIFFVTVEKRVTHSDRDLEIIMFKRELFDYFKRNYWSNNLNMCDFEHRSCEMLAQDVLEAYDLEFAEVLEDNENGACVYKSLAFESNLGPIKES